MTTERNSATSPPSNAEHLPRREFTTRHIGPSDSDLDVMFKTVGVSSLDELMERAVPQAIFDDETLEVLEAPTEESALAELASIAAQNQIFTPMIGTGYYGTHVPAVIQRNMLENPAWYTAYTPYQPEISQGRLEALLNFQTMISDLTGMDIANASMLDEATAAAEAMTLARRVNRAKSNTFVIDANTHPQTIEVVRTRAHPLGIDVSVVDIDSITTGPLDAFGVLISYPGSTGSIPDLGRAIEAVHSAGSFAVVTTDLLALTLLEAPGHLGADAVVGSAQRFGVPLGYGGPHAGFMAVAEGARRSLPGRLVGVSIDTEGKAAYRLALQTREQHIRREKATSNICTAQALLANMASSYAVYHGPDGLRQIARRVHGLASAAAAALRKSGIRVTASPFFDTVLVDAPGQADSLVGSVAEQRINIRRVDDDHVAFSCDETTSVRTVVALVKALGANADHDGVSTGAIHAADELVGIPGSMRRQTTFLEHATFNQYHSETEMMRYLRRLADADLALDRTMIPLGSCTMKLNAAAEMIPVSWPEFSDMHPFAPSEQAAGYAQIIFELQEYLKRITGYDEVSLQPNAGSQGEFAGLLAIREYHRSRGEAQRDICLIPASAHGTNAASAVMAGMRVVVVATDECGNVDMADLVSKAQEHSDDLAAVMVTYPSTHGVFEEGIDELCRVIHDHGGQVYVDGANLNALVGIARPGRFGADVSHLNLHKTFAIPHGGGGPGIGPVAVRSHLAPFLPNHPLSRNAGPATGPGPVSAAPFGSAGILPITWMYITMMGHELRRATQVAVLSANYIAARLDPYFPVLYTGPEGLVAHECIIDLRPTEKSAGITNEDVAKRLIDYGFHAPTMSFPVAGTLMIEPTESESLSEIDRFCDAMISIAEEIRAVADGEWPADDNPLVNAPHTAQQVGADDWNHAYPRSIAGWPSPAQLTYKYWPPVSRIDGGYGDRNLVCSCPSIEELASNS
ncbi:MAG: aminomethyl-transferring glycine dehydrogenase [Microthrixaceae bacterium]|nr:aminomethyl-transferring glycine dehydrogenase [Microthrixaceae bacterium]